ncbi:MBOAT family O-acyltransferase [Rhizorhabdus argentea]|uniref:MBOAT family O-acyltransferase n=1 Tax=Rhizorhabdus argentea TaxID=1387174 RepID=UPI0030EDFCAC
MNVPSTNFLLFAAVVATLFNLHRALIWRQAVLLLANLLFLASFVGHPAELIPYAAFLAAGFGLVQLVRRGIPSGPYVASILVVLFAFFWLKQYTFLPSHIFVTSPYLIVGLSYVFFRVLHVVIDARYPENVPPMNLFDYLNFTLNFTALSSGPIQRYEDYRRTAIETPLPLKATDIGRALERIVTGLFKILVLAVLVGIVQRKLAYELVGDASWGQRIGLGMGLAALYPIYLYFNFSGYTDFVIGIARFLRIELPENFDRPFTAASFIDYWNRWHISLSNWLKTYVYSPLTMTMMRRVKSPKLLPYVGALALFVTFFLIGAWHGRTTKFLFFGLLNGLGVAVNQAYRITATKWLGRKRFGELSGSPVYLFVGRGVTFAWVSFTLLWFWSDWPRLSGFATAVGPSGIAIGWVLLPMVAAIVLGTLIRLRQIAQTPIRDGTSVLNSRYFRTACLSAMFVLILLVQGVMNAAPPEIVYKEF